VFLFLTAYMLYYCEHGGVDLMGLKPNALTLLVGSSLKACSSIWPIKKWVMRCWCGYLSGSKCKWFAYGPADATATPVISLQ